MTEYLVAVTLYVRRGMENAFHDFEARALRVAALNQGKLLRAVRLSETAQDSEAPYEFHLLSFPSSDSFRRFRDDPERIRLREDSDSIICRTELAAGSDCSRLYDSCG